jgi:hypothetical protein
MRAKRNALDALDQQREQEGLAAKSEQETKVDG